jgi:predicted nucleic acid-binding protein
VIVLDGSATIDLLIDPLRGAWVREQLGDDPDLHAPHLLDVEVASGVRALARRATISVSEARRALDDFTALPVGRHAHTLLLARVWQLRASLSAYDGTYVALAEALDAPLVTTDLRLARSHGHRARIVAPS